MPLYVRPPEVVHPLEVVRRNRDILVASLLVLAFFFFFSFYAPALQPPPEPIVTTVIAGIGDLRINKLGKKTSLRLITEMRQCPLPDQVITSAGELSVKEDYTELVANSVKLTIHGDHVIYCGRVTEELTVLGFNVTVYLLIE